MGEAMERTASHTKWLTRERCPKCGTQGMWFAPWSKTLRCDTCDYVEPAGEERGA